MKNLLSTLSLFALTCLFASSATAATDEQELYQVEIIVFSHITEQGLHAETWPTLTDWPITDRAIELAAYAPPKPAATQANAQSPSQGFAQINQSQARQPQEQSTPLFQLLPTQDFTLQQPQSAIEKHQNYHILLHEAWVQPIEKASKTIHLHGGAKYDDEGNVINTIASVLPANDTWELDGTLTLNRNRYFQVASNLLLTEPNQQGLTPNEDEEPAKLNHFSLKQTQRMRSDELHYFDHPLFGMLIKVTPYTTADNSNQQA